MPVRLTSDPRDDRYISLSTHRIHATNIYVVAEVDSTGRLADPRRFSAHTNLTNARKAANRLLSSWGGVAKREEYPPDPGPEQRRPRPVQQANGRWRAKVVRNGTQHQRVFDTEHAAQAFIDRITEEA